VPIALCGRSLTVALTDPTNLALIDELSFRTGCRIRVVIAAQDEIRRASARLYCGLGGIELDLGSDSTPYADDIPLADLLVCTSSRMGRDPGSARRSRHG
jgi:hypothetical protein